MWAKFLIKIGLFIGAYLVGSIPNGLWIGKLFKKIDLREEGSKNIGASNAFRILGFWLDFYFNFRCFKISFSSHNKISTSPKVIQL